MDNLESHYRINIAFKNGDPPNGNYVHYFAVNISNKRKAEEVFADLKTKYPAPDYEVSVTYWDICGKEQDW